MSTINITCPACAQSLEIDEESIGGEVECGACFEVFVAKTPENKTRGKPSPTGKRPTAKSKEKTAKRREDDDDDDDDFDYAPRSRRRSGGSPSSVAVIGLIFGVLSLPGACCCPLVGIGLGLVGFVLGLISVKQPESHGLALSALITGSLGLLCSAGLVILSFANVFGHFNQPWMGR
jgi:predicted Zn finger-like uncharacterized protein